VASMLFDYQQNSVREINQLPNYNQEQDKVQNKSQQETKTQ